jgi:heterodisulfide reductase subunit C2
MPEILSPSAPRSGSVSRKQIEALSGQKIGTCFQCEKCTNGCPMSSAMDIQPNQVMHLVQLGSTDEVINSDTIWVCASCETCTTRCPNDIDIAHVMDTLRHLSVKKGVKTSQKQAPIFHKTFLGSIKRFGRIHEMGMAVEFAMRSEGLQGVLKNMSMGLGMMRRGKLSPIPHRLRAGRQIDTIFRTNKGK